MSTFREHSGKFKGGARFTNSATTQGTFREQSGNIQGTISEHSGNIQGTFREHSVVCDSTAPQTTKIYKRNSSEVERNYTPLDP
jgi:hypothetical protein